MNIEECFDKVMNDEVPANKTAWYEWSVVKTYLQGSPRVEYKECYTSLFDTEPKELETAPEWLILLACMWKAAENGHKRLKLRFSGLDAQCLSLLKQLDEKALNNDKKLKIHIRSGNSDILN